MDQSSSDDDSSFSADLQDSANTDEETSVPRPEDQVERENDTDTDSESDDDTSPPVSKKAKIGRLDPKESLYRAPTSKELSQLKEAENLAQTNLFQLEISGLLSEVTVKDQLKGTIDKFIDRLRKILTGLKPGEKHDLSNKNWLKEHKVKCPVIMSPPSDKGIFQFQPPKSVTVCGSYGLNVALKVQLAIDLAVEMPIACFQDKDYLNQRYLRKRAHYLTVLASNIKSLDLVEELFFMYENGNHMRPLLVLRPTSKQGKNFVVRLLPYPEDGSFRLNRFNLVKNNIRTKWFNAQGEVTDTEAPTPHYNTWVLRDLVQSDNHSYVEHVLGGHSNVRQGIQLLKVWLHQRQLDEGLGCFSGYIMMMYVIYLLSKQKLNYLMNCYQIMRNTLACLSESDWVTSGCSIAPDDSNGDEKPSFADHHRAFDCVFVDRSGYVNLCSDMFTSTYQRVKHEASLALQFTDSVVDSFQNLFMTPVSFLMTFDYVFKVVNLENLSKSVDKLNQKNALVDCCGNALQVIVKQLLALIAKALGNRIKITGTQLADCGMWPVNSTPPDPLCKVKQLTFGVLVNPDTAYNILEKGPAADSAEAVEFREFWGKLSELRRFQDGSICEAAVWKSKTFADRRKVLAKIVKHVFEQHAALPRENIRFMSYHVDPLLTLPRKKNQQKSVVYGTGEEQSQEVHRSYDDLAKCLRNLRDLPLTIHTIQGISAVNRYAEVFPPVPTVDREIRGVTLPHPSSHCPHWTQPIRILCMLESSGKWPEDADAVKRVKAAFLIKISQLLQEDHGIICRIGTQCLDVYKDGYLFRIEIGYLKEVSLLKMFKTPDGMVKMLDNSQASQLQQHLVALPKLTSTLHGLQQQNNIWSSTVCLVKRWLSAQLLHGYINEEAIELLVAHLFLHPAPYTQPNSTMVGFMRVLRLLASHNWKESPLIININREMNTKDVTQIKKTFKRDRSLLPAMFIATPYDKDKSQWTHHKPTAQILNRVVLLAKESLTVLEHHIDTTQSPELIKLVFRPPLEDYDVLIHLRPFSLPRHHHAVDIHMNTVMPTYQDDEHKINDKLMPVVDFSPPMCYLQELRDTYDDIALFFYDIYGGDMITVVWKPNAFGSGPLRFSHLQDRTPVADSVSKQTTLEFNVEAVLEGFELIGKGLVKKVEPQTDNWRQ